LGRKVVWAFKDKWNVKDEVAVRGGWARRGSQLEAL
jgi:hypothetical protein